MKTVLAEEATTRTDVMTTIRADVVEEITTPKPNLDLETIQTETIQTLKKEVLSNERLLSEIQQFTNAQRQGK